MQYDDDSSNRTFGPAHLSWVLLISLLLEQFLYGRTHGVMDISINLPLNLEMVDIFLCFYLSVALIFYCFLSILESGIEHDWRSDVHSFSSYILKWFIRCAIVTTIVLALVSCLYFLFFSQWLWSDYGSIQQMPITSLIFLFLYFLIFDYIMEDIEKLFMYCGGDSLLSKEGRVLVTAITRVLVPLLVIYAIYGKEVVPFLAWGWTLGISGMIRSYCF